MRKVFVFIAIIGMAAMINSCGTAGKISREDKKVAKEARAYRNEKSKEGFRAIGTGDQDAIFYNYLSAKNGVNPIVEFDASAEGSERIIKFKVEHDILAKYASIIKPSNIKERAISEIGEINGETFDNFYLAYESRVNAMVSPSSLHFLKLLKKLGDGNYRYEVYAFEDPNVHTKRMTALYDAARESGLAIEYAEKVSDWVNGN